ncbi:IS6 family transposase [Archaeoglobales archaeon]|nr:MAG: IS6 family transposase [Archaeoglobales archaeon]
MVVQNQDPRAIRGYTILANGGEPKQIGANTFKIPSQSSDKTYTVTNKGDEWHCTCPDHTYRKVICKHIYAVKLWLALKKKLAKEDVVIEETKPACKFCGSQNVIKYGKNGRKQVYKCKNCNRKFVNNINFEKLKYDTHIITLTLDLYFKGVSLRKIADHLKQFYSLNVHYSTIYRWIEKYIKIMDEYVNTLEPELSNVWHADEMAVNIHGDWYYLWNVMDEKTRFLLASVISKERKVEDTRRVFQVAKQRGKKKPKFVVTDGLQAYHKAFNKEFYDHHQSCKHIRNIGFKDKTNNNVIERLHGTVREREKVMRALKVQDTPIIDGYRIYYNFIRPHESLGGNTPAEVAMDLDLGQNKWETLLKLSLEGTCKNKIS